MSDDSKKEFVERLLRSVPLGSRIERFKDALGSPVHEVFGAEAVKFSPMNQNGDPIHRIDQYCTWDIDSLGIQLSALSVNGIVRELQVTGM